MLFFSIIVPVYNVEKYLEPCLISCVRQDLSPDEYEIICVNDGSTDSSGEILTRYEREYPHIRVVTGEHHGVSHARNTALDLAQGEYLIFVDSDDEIRYNILGKIKKLLSETGASWLKSGSYWAVPEEFARMQTENQTSNITEYDLHGKVFERDILETNHLKFNVRLNNAEDTLFTYEYTCYCSDYITLNETTYFYKWRKGSLTYKEDMRFLKKFISEHITFFTILKSKLDQPQYNHQFAFRIWREHIIKILRLTPRLEYADRKQMLLRMKAEQVWLNNLKSDTFDSLWSYIFAKGYTAIKHMEILIYANHVGAHLILLRHKLSDTYFVYFLNHPKRFLRHPVETVRHIKRKRRKKKHHA